LTAGQPGTGEGEGLGLADGLGLGEGLGDDEGDGLGLGAGLGDGLGGGEGLGEGEGDGLREGEGDGLGQTWCLQMPGPEAKMRGAALAPRLSRPTPKSTTARAVAAATPRAGVSLTRPGFARKRLARAETSRVGSLASSKVGSLASSNVRPLGLGFKEASSAQQLGVAAAAGRHFAQAILILSIGWSTRHFRPTSYLGVGSRNRAPPLVSLGGVADPICLKCPERPMCPVSGSGD
jgi:hypothetical protein